MLNGVQVPQQQQQQQQFTVSMAQPPVSTAQAPPQPAPQTPLRIGTPLTAQPGAAGVAMGQSLKNILALTTQRHRSLERDTPHREELLEEHVYHSAIVLQDQHALQ